MTNILILSNQIRPPAYGGSVLSPGFLGFSPGNFDQIIEPVLAGVKRRDTQSISKEGAAVGNSCSIGKSSLDVNRPPSIFNVDNLSR